jgi:hypothetical protein
MISLSNREGDFILVIEVISVPYIIPVTNTRRNEKWVYVMRSRSVNID